MLMTMPCSPSWLRCSIVSLGLLLGASAVSAEILITEIAPKGSMGICDGNDWIELHNSGSSAVDLSQGFLLHDDNGPDDQDAYQFPPEMPALEAGEYRFLCTRMTTTTTTTTASNSILSVDPHSPQFGIGGADTITLLNIVGKDNNTLVTPTLIKSLPVDNFLVKIVATVGPLPNTEDYYDITYARDPETGLFNYTSTPTPGAPNVMTRVPTWEERVVQHRAEFKAQDDLGRQFFGMDERGYKVDNGMEELLELHVSMATDDYAYIDKNQTFEVYRPFQNATVRTKDGQQMLVLDKPGRIRPKGQSTLFIATCVDTDTIPFQLDFDAFDSAQTLFGAQRVYLRHHMGDYSYMRDWAYNRMLARFGLPYLRARKVHFYINNELRGLYTLMEAPDQEYVFARNFPNYNPESYGLYKIKSMSSECGHYTPEEIEAAENLVDDTSIPPYSFQRGAHKDKVKQLGMFEFKQCLQMFRDKVWDVDFLHVVVAYLRYDEDCGDMLMGEGLVDRDLGTKDWDKPMKQFIRDALYPEEKCEPGCEGSNMKNKVDIENFLKSFAFYAVTVNSDSPLINGNNFYLAQAGDEDFGGPGGWKIQAYDFNAAQVVFCEDTDICNSRMVHWSIARPTCKSLEDNNLAGPLLSDPELHAQYLGYVEQFVNDIYGNETFVAELQEHAAAMDPYVREDFWSVFGAFYDKELSPDAADWRNEKLRFPLLPTMKARAEDVRAQLAAIKGGTFPRGPHVGLKGDNEPWEFCVDWRMEEQNTSGCELGCQYEGCHMEGWAVPSFCSEIHESCFHGEFDPMCHGVYDGSYYEGMPETSDGRPTFCWYAAGVPVRASECPAVGAVKTVPPSGESAASSNVSLLIQGMTAMVAMFLLW